MSLLERSIYIKAHIVVVPVIYIYLMYYSGYYEYVITHQRSVVLNADVVYNLSFWLKKTHVVIDLLLKYTLNNIIRNKLYKILVE